MIDVVSKAVKDDIEILEMELLHNRELGNIQSTAAVGVQEAQRTCRQVVNTQFRRSLVLAQTARVIFKMAGTGEQNTKFLQSKDMFMAEFKGPLEAVKTAVSATRQRVTLELGLAAMRTSE